jgi:hypothetical protein
MQVDEYVLYCTNCGFVHIKAEESHRGVRVKGVYITLDLDRGVYEFRATCPTCGGRICMTRPTPFI